MKKIILILPLFIVGLNAEMMGIGESSNFISSKDRSEMNEIINEEKDTRVEMKEDFDKKIKKPVQKRSQQTQEMIDEELIVEEKEPAFQVKEVSTTTLAPEVKEVKKSKRRRSVLRPKQNLENNKNKKGVSGDEEDLAIGEGDVSPYEEKRIELTQFRIRYQHKYDKYSFEHPNKASFNMFLKQNSISEDKFEEMLDSAKDPRSIRMSALYYDFVLQRADYAENFYKIMYKNRKKLGNEDMFLLADYILRTGRGEKLNLVVSKKKCNISFDKKFRGRCFFYLGYAEYLRTGNRKNKYMRLAKDKLPMPKLFYKGKI